MVEAFRGLQRGLGEAAHRQWHAVAKAFPLVGRTGMFIEEVVRKYHHDDCLTYAASLSFFLTISLIPLATLFFKLLGLMLGSGAYSADLLRTINGMYPYLPQGFILDTIQHSRRIGGIGSSWIVLFVGAHWGVNQLDRSLSHIFGLRIKVHRQTRKYNFFRRMGVVLGGLLFLVVLLASGFQWTLARQLSLPPILMTNALPPLLGLLLVTVVLQYLPRLHVLFRHALLGASVTTVLWWVAKVGFGWYLKHTPTWGVLYGSLGSLMASLVFLYYSCAIFMLGAEVTAAFYRHQTTGAMPIRKWL